MLIITALAMPSAKPISTQVWQTGPFRRYGHTSSATRIPCKIAVCQIRTARARGMDPGAKTTVRRRPGGLAEARLFAVRVGLDQLEKIIALFVKALDRLAFVEAVNAVAVGVGEPTRDAIGGNSCSVEEAAIGGARRHRWQHRYARKVLLCKGLGGAVDQRGQRRWGRSRADFAGRGYGQRRVGGDLGQLCE